MSAFCEQIGAVPKSRGAFICQIVMWLSSVLLMLLALFLTIFYYQYAAFLFLAASGIVFGAYRMSGKLNIEFEYSLVDDTLNIDKIVNRKKRTRFASIECCDIRRAVPYDPEMPLSPDRKRLFCAFSEETYMLETAREYLIFSPNEKMREAIRASLPRLVQKDAFNGN